MLITFTPKPLHRARPNIPCGSALETDPTCVSTVSGFTAARCLAGKAAIGASLLGR